MKFFWLPLLWLTIITVLSLMPGSDIPKATWLDEIHADKLVHMGMYAVLLFLLLRAQSKHKQKSYRSLYQALPFVLFGMSYGISMELIQLFFTDSRKFEVADMIANSIGAILGMVGFYLIMNRQKK